MMLYLVVKVMWVFFQALVWMCYALAKVTIWLVMGMFIFIPWLIMRIVQSSKGNQVTTH